MTEANNLRQKASGQAAAEFSTAAKTSAYNAPRKGLPAGTKQGARKKMKKRKEAGTAEEETEREKPEKPTEGNGQ